MKNTIKVSGIQEKKIDKRDFNLGVIFNLPDPSVLPPEYLLPELPIKDQTAKKIDNDKCVAYATCRASEFQEEEELVPDYSFALGKEYEDPNEWGLQLRNGMKGHAKKGALAKKHVVEALLKSKNFEDDSYRFIKTWNDQFPDFATQALFHKKKSYFDIVSKYDSFDTIRIAMWHFRKEKLSIPFGVKFSWGLEEVYLVKPSENGFGHAMTTQGFKRENGTDYIVVANSAGRSVGRNGYHLVSREVMNEFVPRFGAFGMIDMNPEEAKRLLEELKKPRSWFTTLAESNLWVELRDIMKEITFAVFKDPDARYEVDPFLKEITKNLKEEKPMENREIKELLPLVQRQADLFIQKATEAGYTLRITSGYRTPQEQNEIYSKGRTSPGNIVTNAKAGYSFHNFGCAIDIVDRYRGYDLFPSQWNHLGAIGESCGFAWGGRWTTFRDREHFELTLGYSLEDFQEKKVDLSKFN